MMAAGLQWPVMLLTEAALRAAGCGFTGGSSGRHLRELLCGLDRRLTEAASVSQTESVFSWKQRLLNKNAQKRNKKLDEPVEKQHRIT
ncbi:hypothetical protein PAMP_001971 [Pampus punctatissimus]